MAFTKQQILNLTEAYVKKTMADEPTGHDNFHVVRVLKMAELISKEEKQGDLFLIKLSALLHDIADWKFHNADDTVGAKVARQWLEKLKVDKNIIDEICFINFHISYKGGIKTVPMRTIEGEIVQDADRLDALGAIGIARVFAYGGYKQRQIYNPKIKLQKYKKLKKYLNTNATSVNHFYEKLFSLKEKMNTKTGKQIAAKRHKFMEDYLKEFYGEWDVKV